MKFNQKVWLVDVATGERLAATYYEPLADGTQHSMSVPECASDVFFMGENEDGTYRMFGEDSDRDFHLTTFRLLVHELPEGCFVTLYYTEQTVDITNCRHQPGWAWLTNCTPSDLPSVFNMEESEIGVYNCETEVFE